MGSVRKCAVTLLAGALLWVAFGIFRPVGAADADPSQLSQRERRAGGVYRLPLLNSPGTLDPAYVHDIYAAAVVRQLFDGLVQFTSDLLVIPAIAENWRLEDGGKTYRFFLRKDARFHDGTPITAHDVQFSLSRLLRVSPSPTILPHLLQVSGAKAYQEGKADAVTGFQAPTPDTFLIRLDQPYVPILSVLGMPQASILPAAEVTHSQSFGQTPVGSGPFQFERWEEQRIVRVKRYDGYYGGKSLLDGIDFLIYPGVAIEKVWEDFRDNKLEEMPVYPQIAPNLRNIPDLTWLHRPSLSLLFYGINDKSPLLKDRALRHSMSDAIDREKLNREVYNGQYNPADSILPPGMPGYDPAAGRRGDARAVAIPETGNAPLADASGLKRIEVVSGSRSPLAQAELAFVAEAWKRIGIELVPKFIPDWAEFERYVKSDSVQLYRYAWFADIPDPDGFLRILFGSDSLVNYSHFKDQEVDGLFRKAVGETDPNERAKLYQLAEKRILEACPAIPLLYLSVDHVYQPRVRGVALSVLGAHTTSYHSVWLDETLSK